MSRIRTCIHVSAAKSIKRAENAIRREKVLFSLMCNDVDGEKKRGKSRIRSGVRRGLSNVTCMKSVEDEKLREKKLKKKKERIIENYDAQFEPWKTPIAGLFVMTRTVYTFGFSTAESTCFPDASQNSYPMGKIEFLSWRGEISVLSASHFLCRWNKAYARSTRSSNDGEQRDDGTDRRTDGRASRVCSRLTCYSRAGKLSTRYYMHVIIRINTTTGIYTLISVHVRARVRERVTYLIIDFIVVM